MIRVSNLEISKYFLFVRFQRIKKKISIFNRKSQTFLNSRLYKIIIKIKYRKKIYDKLFLNFKIFK